METKTEQVLWGIHGGRTGDADNLFLKHNVIALGWTEMSDLSELPGDRDAFKKKLMILNPDRKPGYYPVAAGQIFRFIHEAKNGDFVIYPSKRDLRIHIGEITGPYKYEVKPEPNYPQHRSVKWLKDFPRAKFSQGALYEIGSAMSFFLVKNYAYEYLAALSGQALSIADKQENVITYLAEEIEKNTSAYIINTLARELKGHSLAEFVAHLLETMGYRFRLADEGPDGGIDIIAHKDELGFEPPIIKVQVKSTEGSIGDPIVSQLYGKVEKSEYGMVVTLGTFTNQAKSFARNKSNLRLIDGEEFVGLVLKHYEQFNSRYKGLLPLKQVYVPEPLEEEEL